MERKLITTADGSSSLFVPSLNENYHSIHGARQESMHVFIDAGLKQIKKDSINILEMGYGTGLNFILTYLYSENKNINYHGIEFYPLDLALVKKLNYTEILELSQEQSDLFLDFHLSDKTKIVSERFCVNKYNIPLQEFDSETGFDLIYFDAFAPEVQPELWSVQIFEKLFRLTNPGGILCTYCAKGQVRRNMIAAGYKVERLQGPPGKREMIRATKMEI